MSALGYSSEPGTGGKESEIYFADFNDVLIGEDGAMVVDFSREATYIDADGNTVSAFARNQSLIRVIMEHDIGFRHIEGGAGYRRYLVILRQS